MTKNNSLQKTTILMVLLLLLVIGCVLLFLLFIYPQVFVLGVSVDEKYGTDYQGLGSARIIPRSSGEEIRIEGDSIVLPDGFYDSNYEVVELYDETELQSGGRRGSTKGDECGKDNDCDGQIDEGSSICGVNQVCSQGMCAAILCTGNSDCGSDGFIGSRYCQGNTVHQDFKTFMCANAGSASSSCSSTTNSVPIKQCAGNEMCSNGACVGVTCSTTQAPLLHISLPAHCFIGTELV